MPKKITIHEEDYERLKNLSREDAGLILHNLLHTAYDEPIEKVENEYVDYFSEVVCQKMLRFAELSETRSRIGALGKGKSKTKANESKSKAKVKQSESKSKAKAKPNTITNTNTYTITNTLSNTKTNTEIKNIIVLNVIDYLNEKTGKHFRDSKDTTRLIEARLSEGYTEEDFKTVIDKKTAEWINDPKYSQYLQPSTLFAPSHFDNYLNQGVKKGTDDMLMDWLKGAE